MPYVRLCVRARVFANFFRFVIFTNGFFSLCLHSQYANEILIIMGMSVCVTNIIHRLL